MFKCTEFVRTSYTEPNQTFSFASRVAANHHHHHHLHHHHVHNRPKAAASPRTNFSLPHSLVGLKVIVISPCNGTTSFQLSRNDAIEWPVYFSLCVIAVLHWSSAVSIRIFFRDYVVSLRSKVPLICVV